MFQSINIGEPSILFKTSSAKYKVLFSQSLKYTLIIDHDILNNSEYINLILLAHTLNYGSEFYTISFYKLSLVLTIYFNYYNF